MAKKVSARRRSRKYEPEFKRKAVDRILAGESPTGVVRKLRIRRKFLYQMVESRVGNPGAGRNGGEGGRIWLNRRNGARWGGQRRPAATTPHGLRR